MESCDEISEDLEEKLSMIARLMERIPERKPKSEELMKNDDVLCENAYVDLGENAYPSKTDLIGKKIDREHSHKVNIEVSETLETLGQSENAQLGRTELTKMCKLKVEKTDGVRCLDGNRGDGLDLELEGLGTNGISLEHSNRLVRKFENRMEPKNPYPNCKNISQSESLEPAFANDKELSLQSKSIISHNISQ